MTQIQQAFVIVAGSAICVGIICMSLLIAAFTRDTIRTLRSNEAKQTVNDSTHPLLAARYRLRGRTTRFLKRTG